MKKINILIVLIVFGFVGLQAQNNIGNAFFDKADAFFKMYVKNGRIDYKNLKNNASLNNLIKEVSSAKLTNANSKTKQAFFINAYNLHVIKGAADAYPLKSVLDVNGFFDTKKRLIAGEKLTLNQLEKDRLLKTYKDARFHFVLVCGAVGCPPITDFAYRPGKLEQQLATQTRKALNDPTFVKVNDAAKKVELSQIFEWYSKDFGGSKASAIQFINKYRKTPIPSSYKVGFYSYDWSLNGQLASNSTPQISNPQGNNASRYVVSAAIPKGGIEVKWFNNLYTQRTGNGEGDLTDRSTFFTSSLSFVYGLTSRFNIGFDARYRRVRNDQLPSSPFSVLGSGEGVSSRQGFTSFGPKIRWAPFEALPNFSVQSAFWFPIGDNLEGTADQPFIDWDGATWWTQFFNDFSIGENFSLFTEVDVLLEDIGNKETGHLNRFSTPATVILSYFPNPKTTLYALTGFSPFWQADFDYFAQAGLGAKYQFTPNFELELLYTAFTNEFLQNTGGRASTFNIGVRISR